MQDRNTGFESEGNEVREIRRPGILTDASKLLVAKLIDAYLAEIATDHNLPLSKFVDLAEMVSCVSRPAHNGLYRAINMYLKEHPWMSKNEKKRICKLIDCKKLSADACMHAIQNERLPLRLVMQILYFEQVRACTASSGSSTPDLPKSLKDPNSRSHGSSGTETTNPEVDWDAVSASKELKALKAELAALRLSNGGDRRNSVDNTTVSKMKGFLKSESLFTNIRSNKAAQGENSGSDSSENPKEARSTASKNR